MRVERLVRDQCSSLLQKVITYGHKKFYNIGHRCQFHKHLALVTHVRRKIS
jgi:hypothetical protein